MDLKILNDRKISVTSGKCFSGNYCVENETPPGVIVSPVLFSNMINHVFSSVDRSIWVLVFSNDEVIWKSGAKYRTQS